MLDQERIRRLFPGLEGRTFLDAASIGLAPTTAVEAVREMAELACRPRATDTGSHHVELARLRAPTRAAVARLIGAEPAHIALTENASQGLSQAAAAIPMEEGDNVVLSRIDFLATAVPWSRRREREGIEVRFVPPREGRIEAEDLAARIDSRTRAVCVSSVQWTSGHRIDLAAISALCRDRGIWLIVDGAQQVGCTRLDVDAVAVDFLACSGHKWLNSPFGCGFLYVGARAAEVLAPPHPGYLAAEPPRGNWGIYFSDPEAGPGDALTYPDSARPWETGGTPNFPGAAALRASIEVVQGLGAEAVEEHVLSLSGHLIDRLEEIGAQVITPRDRSARAGIVSFGFGTGIEDERALVLELEARRVQISVRYAGNVGGLRASVHFYNDESDVERLVGELHRLR